MLSDIHPDLRGRIALYYVLGFIWATIGAGALLYLVFVGGSDVKLYACVLVFGAVMLFLGWLMVFNAPNWYRRANRVLQTQPPETMLLTLRKEESSDSTTLYADLRVPGSSHETAPARSVAVLSPKWNADQQENQPVEVYEDSDGPVVIRTPQGLLWSVPHKRIGPLPKLASGSTKPDASSSKRSK
jgi:hypothetical protein